MSDTTTVPGLPPAGGPSQRPSAPLPPPPVPDHELLCRIGRGAYGEVWLARSVTGAFRAVKIVHRQSFDHDRPFEREFEGILKFEPVSRRHDSQVDILHVGRGQDCFYYVMELADDQATGGQINPEHYTPRTLKSDVLFRSRLPFEECVQIGVALATALQYLHENGLVHRDVKPSNIIFVNGVPKLADIGLVTGVDATRSYVGTEGFAAPEGPGTPQADLYSFGKVLYEISTGKDRQEFPELPTQLRELPDRDGLMELNAVIAKACRHDPRDRYASAAAMRADLELLQSGKSLARLHRTEAQLRFVRRAGAVVTALAALIAAGWLWQARQTHLVRDLANEKIRLAAEKSQLANENREQLVRLRVANGVRLMDAGDYSGALLWFAEALPLVTNNPAEESIHRIRIQALLNQHPKLVQCLNYSSLASAAALSPDGQDLATVGDSYLRIWDATSRRLLVGPLEFFTGPGVRYSRDGGRLLLGGSCEWGVGSKRAGGGDCAVVDAATGREIWPAAKNVHSTTFSPDDRWLAVAHPGTNFAIDILDTSDGHRVCQLRGHTDQVEDIAFSRDGKLVASAGQDKTARLWAIPSSEAVGRPIVHINPVSRVVLSPDAQRLATAEVSPFASGRALVHTWQTLTGTEVGPPVSVLDTVHGLAFDNTSGRKLVVAGGENLASVLDADSHAELFPGLSMERNVLSCLAFSPDGLLLATGDSGGNARVWDLQTGKPVTPLLYHGDRVRSVQFSPDGVRLVSASNGGEIKIWSLESMAEGERQLEIPGLFLSSEYSYSRGEELDLSQDGKRLLISTVPGQLQFVDLETAKLAGPPLVHSGSNVMGAVRFDASGHQWATSDNTGSASLRGATNCVVYLWREEGGTLRQFELVHPGVVGRLYFSPDGRRLWTWCDDCRLRTWQTDTGQLLDERQVADRQHGVWTMSADGERAVLFLGAAPESDHHPEVFDLRQSPATGKTLRGYNMASLAAFSPDGKRVALVFRADGWICDSVTGDAIPKLPFHHGGNLDTVEWSPDGREVLTSGSSRSVKSWDATTGRLAHPPMELGNRVITDSSYSPDGRFVVAHDAAGLLRVWDARTSEPVTPILHHASGRKFAAITGGNRLVSVCYPAGVQKAELDLQKQIIQVWDLKETTLPPVLVADYAKLLAGRGLDSAGVFQPLNTMELDRTFQSLLTNVPALFPFAADKARQWQRQQIPDPKNLVLVREGLLKLERMAQLDPTDSWVKRQQARFQVLGIPARDPATPANLLDLSHAYTHSFEMMPNQEFAALPRGVQQLGGTPFDVRGLAFLERVQAGEQALWGELSSVRNIALGRRCRQIHFLHASEREVAPEGQEVARWVIHYADGSVRKWPVRYGEHLRDWWWLAKHPKEASAAVIAWEGHPSTPLLKGAENVRLFKATWTNPQPDIEITHLDFVLGNTRLRPFVVAITAE